MRLIEAWFYYKFISLKNELKETNLHAFFIKDLDLNISGLNPMLRNFFTNKWNGLAHRNYCRDANCSKLLVVDGNHKCTRLRCMFENVEFHVKEIGICF